MTTKVRRRQFQYVLGDIYGNGAMQIGFYLYLTSVAAADRLIAAALRREAS